MLAPGRNPTQYRGLRGISVDKVLFTLFIKRAERASLFILFMKRAKRAAILTRFFYVYLTMIVFLDRNFVFNSCNNQYNQFYCLNYFQISVYNSKKFVILIYFCLYFVLLLKQSLHFKHYLFTKYQKTHFSHVSVRTSIYVITESFNDSDKQDQDLNIEFVS